MPVKTGMRRVAVLTTGVALAVGGCSAGTDDGGDSGRPVASASKSASKSAGPDRALVKWADQMCEATELFETMKTDSAAEVKEITDPSGDAGIASDLAVIGYLMATSSSFDEVAQGLDSVRPSGITTADRLHDTLAKEVERAQPKVTELTDRHTFLTTERGSVNRVERLGKLIQSLKMPEPDLPAVVAKEPNLQAAYRTAPNCAPPEPLPKAADGTNASACKDGTCEILVTKRTDVVVGGWNLRVSLTETKATVLNNGPRGGVGQFTLGADGTGTFGSRGDRLTIHAVAVNEDGAVLKFT
ncbi:hypothetical protein [Streptomyces yerevanensis]|uniref:hypothetical protein n=1 Tax=Streptomyces yerevanensis TaxID=66378 RepID=UPI000527B601|nr:hypothetical protein [Streptomyces yerevanensis]